MQPGGGVEVEVPPLIRRIRRAWCLGFVGLAAVAAQAQDPRVISCFVQPLSFYTVTPCRVIDTRNPGGGGAILAGSTRVISIAGACGIPADAVSISLNMTAVDSTVTGNLTAYPPGATVPTATAISMRVGHTRANNGIYKLGGGSLAIFNRQPSGSTQLIVDVNGYFKG